MDLVGLPSMAKAVEIRRALEQAEMRSRQRLWAERGAQALAAAEDMPDDEGMADRWARASYMAFNSCIQDVSIAVIITPMIK